MNSPSLKPQRKPLFPILIFALICAALMVVAWTANSSAAQASVNSVSTPTHGQHYGYVEIAKPTYTASPTLTSLPIPTSTEIQTSTPESVVRADIVMDTPAPGHIAPAAQDASQQTYSTPPVNGGNKLIVVDISEQHMYVYEGGTLIWSFVASTGMGNSTRIGSFSVLEKIPNAYGATWNIWMPDWLGIYWSGSLQNGIHALPILPSGAQLWEGYLGTPISFGCVVLGTQDAQMLYDWADIGTPVDIQR